MRVKVSDAWTTFRSRAARRWYSSSDVELSAIRRKRENSRALCWPQCQTLSFLKSVTLHVRAGAYFATYHFAARRLRIPAKSDTSVTLVTRGYASALSDLCSSRLNLTHRPILNSWSPGGIDAGLACLRRISGLERLADGFRARNSRAGKHAVLFALSKLLFFRGLLRATRDCSRGEEREDQPVQS